MMTINQIRQNLEAARGSWPKIANETGISYWTLSKLVRGVIVNPHFNTIERLHLWFEHEATFQEKQT